MKSRKTFNMGGESEEVWLTCGDDAERLSFGAGIPQAKTMPFIRCTSQRIHGISFVNVVA